MNEDFDADIDERKRILFLCRLGEAKALAARPLSKWRTRKDVCAALAILAMGLPVALVLRAIGL